MPIQIHRPADAGNSAWICVYGIYHQIESFEISSNIALDYVRTARAKGMSNGSVMNRHVLRNSMIPVVTYLGQDLGALMGGAMISETIFNVHGIGYLTYQSILKGEGNLVVSIVTLLMLIFAVCNLLVDMLYAALDPRIRYA